MNNHQDTDRETSQETGEHVTPAQPVNPWLEAARSIPTPAPAATSPAPAQDQATQDEQETNTDHQRPVFVGAHGGAGATAWAGILGGVDAGNINTWITSEQEPDTAVVLVLRASLDGVTAAKTALARHGAEAFTAGLVVAAGPGRTPRRINDELKILAGAVPLARAPWVPELLIKRAVNTAPTDLPSKELRKLTTTLDNHGVHTEGETK